MKQRVFFTSIFLITFLMMLGPGIYAATIPQINWVLADVDSQEVVGENGAVTNAFDGNRLSLWHTKWYGGSDPMPHRITIDLGSSYAIEGFRYLPRQDGGMNGTIKNYEFYVSSDGVTWGSPAAQGVFASNTSEKEILFGSVIGRFIRLVALSEINGKAWTSMAEINVLGQEPSANQPPESVIDLPSSDVTINVGEWVEFAGTGSDPDFDTPLSFQWKFGAGSGVSDSTLQDPGLVQFNSTGTFKVTLTVTDGLGLADSSPANRVITVQTVTSVIPQTGWKIVYVDSQETTGENGAATNAFDGNKNSSWHTQWYKASPPYPHEIQIDLGSTYVIDGFRYLPRQEGETNGIIKNYQFYVSSDGVTWGSSVASGTFASDTTEKEVLFTPINARFIRLVALSEINGQPWTSMAEISVLGEEVSENQHPEGSIDLPSSDMTINVGTRIQFAGSASDPDFNSPLSYLWRFGTGSGVSDSTLQDPGLIQFSNPGTFTVTFTVADALGVADPTPATRVITVQSGSGGAFAPDWAAVPHSPFNLETPAGVVNPVLTAADVTDLQAEIAADPFLFYENGTWYLFFEAYDGRGYIALATSSDGVHWTYDRVVLSEPFHLSYPLVFKYNGRYYMVPESYQASSVRLYEATNFPYGWNYVSTLASGRSFVDPTVFRYNGIWWMFVSGTSMDACWLYYSDNLISGWTEHPMSPVVTGKSKSRGGGRTFVFDTDRVIRVAQKDDVNYGEQVRAFEVDILTKTSYLEHEIPESPLLVKSGIGWNATGMHNFDPWWNGSFWLCATDGSDALGNWSIGIYGAYPPLPPNGIIDIPVGDITINVGESVQFAGSGMDQDGHFPLNYHWEFGADSGIPDSTLEDPGLKQFNNLGTFTVTFTVTDSLGLVDPIPPTRVITVQNVPSVISHTGWKLLYVDSQETTGENGAATNAFDGNRGSIWHTQWYSKTVPLPHEIQIDLGSSHTIAGFRYLPRQDGEVNGTIKGYEFYVSTDGVNWGGAVASGTFAGNATEKEVFFAQKAGRFVRLRALSEINGKSWTSAAEINVIGW